jgi:hypothetical protein
LQFIASGKLAMAFCYAECEGKMDSYSHNILTALDFRRKNAVRTALKVLIIL